MDRNEKRPMKAAFRKGLLEMQPLQCDTSKLSISAAFVQPCFAQLMNRGIDLRVRFTAVHLVGGNRHEHIASLKAVNVATGQQYDDTRAKWVTYIEQGNSGFVHDRYGNEIGVYVNHNGYIKWVQTYADGIWTDNLLQLPKY